MTYNYRPQYRVPARRLHFEVIKGLDVLPHIREFPSDWREFPPQLRQASLKVDHRGHFSSQVRGTERANTVAVFLEQPNRLQSSLLCRRLVDVSGLFSFEKLRSFNLISQITIVAKQLKPLSL